MLAAVTDNPWTLSSWTQWTFPCSFNCPRWMVLPGGFSPGGDSGIQDPSILYLCLLLGRSSGFPSGSSELGWQIKKEKIWETRHFLWVKLRSGSHHFCLNVIDQDAAPDSPAPNCRASYFLFLLAICLRGKGNRIWQTCSVVSATNETSKREWWDNQNSAPWFTIIGETHTQRVCLWWWRVRDIIVKMDSTLESKAFLFHSTKVPFNIRTHFRSFWCVFFNMPTFCPNPIVDLATDFRLFSNAWLLGWFFFQMSP